MLSSTPMDAAYRSNCRCPGPRCRRTGAAGVAAHLSLIEKLFADSYDHERVRTATSITVEIVRKDLALQRLDPIPFTGGLLVGSLPRPRGDLAGLQAL